MNDEYALYKLNTLTSDDYVRAFTALHEQISETEWAILHAHYKALESIATAAELAEAAGLPHYQTVHARYRSLAKKLLDFFGLSLAKQAQINALVEIERDLDGTRVWVLRPQITEALAKMGF